MIRLALVIPTLDRSGAERQLTLLATGLPRDEFEIRVFALSRGGPYAVDLEKAGITVEVLHKRFRIDPLCLWRLYLGLHKFQPDIVHGWLFAANASVRLIPRVSAAVKTVVSERCVDTWKSGWQLWLDRRLAARADRLLANSQSVADFYSREVGFSKDRISVIPNGCSVNASVEESRSRLRERLGVPDDTFVIGYVGRLAPQKRIEDLIEAFHLLRFVIEDAQFVIVGDGPSRDRLHELAISLECDQRVHFVGHQENSAEWTAGVDTFWMASEFEGLSNSLMEAMALGVPCVATDIGPNQELIRHEQDGLLVPLRSAPRFTEAVARLHRDEELRRRLTESAQRRIADGFSVTEMVASHHQLYRELVTGTAVSIGAMAKPASRSSASES